MADDWSDTDGRQSRMSKLIKVFNPKKGRMSPSPNRSVSSFSLATASDTSQSPWNKIDALYNIERLLEIGENVGEAAGSAFAPIKTACGIAQVFVKTAQVRFTARRNKKNEYIQVTSGSATE